MDVSLDDQRAPRLTCFLRSRASALARENGDGGHGDARLSQSELILQRRAKLQEAVKRLQSGGAGAPGGNNAHASFTWDSLQRGKKPQPAMRKKFTKFMELCASFAADEEQAVGERLEAIASDLFEGFNGEAGLKKLDIELKLGNPSIKKSDVVEARSLAQELFAWTDEGDAQKKDTGADLGQMYRVPGPGSHAESVQKIDLDSDGTESDGADDDVGREGAGASAGAPRHDEEQAFPQGENPVRWLEEQCMLHVSKLDQGNAMNGADLAASIRALLSSDASSDELQGQLFDLLGMSEGTFELIASLLAKRSALAIGDSGSPSSQSATAPASRASNVQHTGASASGFVMPAFAPSSRSSATGGRNNITVRMDASDPAERNARKLALPVLQNGSRPAGTREEHMTMDRITGPGADAEGDEGKGRYVQVEVPAPKKKFRPDDDARVPISAFGSLAQVAFEGIPSLNRLQSAVFTMAYHTNHNLLVCAPTGAGKTNVAMTAVVREIEQHAEDIHAVKIIYVAPMKALAQEVVDKFGQRLKPLGIKVRELTGDMQLTRTEIEKTQVIVTTPEKWDVITRKSGDGTLVEAVGLLIIDEVHLIGEDRGPVIESLVARTLRLVEQKQRMVRIVGLSATLPNYRDAAEFLRVDPLNGLFFFDNAYRPVPLDQTFIGVIEKNVQKKLAMYNDIAFEKAVDSIRRGHQVMIFVHSRKDTGKTARALLEAAQKKAVGIFETAERVINKKSRDLFAKDVAKSKSGEVRELFQSGIGVHHAGMLRADRSLTEKMFAKQAISVLCCTATLAWGVNLPVHTVIIKGTQIYVAEKGGLVELNMQDVFQCFGRAGRPQYDTRGEAVLITEKDQLNRYLSMLNHALPLESQLDKHLPDALNAEIVSGTVTNLEEAAEWLSYTFLHIRMMRNPVRYGITHKELQEDPTLLRRRAELIVSAARELDRARMSRFALGPRTAVAMGRSAVPDLQAPFGVTDLGRVASHYYIGHGTIEEFNTKLRPGLTDAQVLDLLCHASEFDNLKVREEEISELGKLRKSACAVDVLSPADSPRGKACILLQTYITRSFVRNFTLSSDMSYISQNMGRIARAVFEIVLKKRWSGMSEKMLAICTALDKRCWWPPYAHPLRQFVPQFFAAEMVKKLEDRGDSCSLENLVEMDGGEINSMLRHQHLGQKVLRVCRHVPYLQVEAHLQPLTRTILRVSLDIFPDFDWNDRVHGAAQSFWFWVDDQNSEWIYHAERFTLRKADWKAARHLNSENHLPGADGDLDGEDGSGATESKMHPALAALALQNSSSTRREFTIPIFEPLPPQYYLRIFSDTWFGSEAVVPLTLDKLVLPAKVKQHTDLLALAPLPRSALHDDAFERMYARKFSHFNPIQTQIFHVMYHTDENVLLGAPTGSGKTISSELALLRVFKQYPKQKVVYIAPLKALVAERSKEWQETLGKQLNKRVVEFTGDVTPDPGVLRRADVLITTPEKWDGASRMWQDRSYVKQVRLVIIDEIHLLGEERGAVLEVIVTRMRYIAETTGHPVRIVGLSTALANAHDLASWLGIRNEVGLYNFRPAVRPVPLEAHIHGFPGKHYCPRMATMTKPAYQAILTHSPTKPVLIFVASRRQTRITSMDLISLCASSDNPRRFLHMDAQDMDAIIQSGIDDETLRHTLAFGIGIHHAGLSARNRDIVEELFVNGKIQILVCTSTLAWGVNFPAHLVVIKGTEYYDAKTKRYQPFPVTDVLQMMGRAGRPQFDQEGVAMIFVEESLKDFYKKFLYEPFPVESHLPEFLHNHLNAEIAAGSITNEREALDYLSWTYFFRRLPANPSYYGLDSADTDAVALFLIRLVRQILADLGRAGCLRLEEHKGLAMGGQRGTWNTETSVTNKTDKEILDKNLSNVNIAPTRGGKTAAFYYLDYRTVALFSSFVRERRNKRAEDNPAGPVSSVSKLVRKVFETIVSAHEFAEVPVRHNEDLLNRDFSEALPWDPFGVWSAEDPHCKAFLLLQAHCKGVPMPIKDYVGDLRSVFDQSARVVAALIEIAADHGDFEVVRAAMRVSQSCTQARWFSDSALSHLPGVKRSLADELAAKLEGESDSVIDDLLRVAARDLRSLRIPKTAKAALRSIPLFAVSGTIEDSGSMLHLMLEVVNKDEAKADLPRAASLVKIQKHSWWVLVCDAKDRVVHSKHLIGFPQRPVSMRFVCRSDAPPTTVRILSGAMGGLDQEFTLPTASSPPEK
ncbi:Activating signal cointegrator 1 complex subunit 3 [Hondaea fermentalgiana]|uniref:Activating signal cointegrator 1 complex subunit 3 n=1 Tax=Hondaea fermentalgiana TaxID=2315210 RepID=A0A2R5G730_9STRA|nr:Activating signal cointegrator 1 complex subunit 3 [Hondaea fermentalgiana]|eukprot:GBG24263.1 Activating signal cointegrator 1 complex subunit 3 [Hondaea fermentalgiana]